MPIHGGPDPLQPLIDHPGVAEAVHLAREACTSLRWHPAMRRRSDQVRAEACVRAAAASAELDGARLPLEQVRRLVDPAGSAPGPGGDPVAGAVRGALRATLDAHPQAGSLATAPRQVMARLHVLAASDLVSGSDRDGLGRPGRGSAPRVDALARLLSGGSAAPSLLLAALADAECEVTDAFPPVSGVVGRALARTVVVAGGLDPFGVVVPERHALADRGGRDSALAGYRAGGPDGVVEWVRWWGRAVVAGAQEGGRVADAVLAGRLT